MMQKELLSTACYDAYSSAVEDNRYCWKGWSKNDVTNSFNGSILSDAEFIPQLEKMKLLDFSYGNPVT